MSSKKDMYVSKFKLNKLKIQFLSRTSYVSSTQQPHMVSDYQMGQHRHRTLLSPQKVLSDALSFSLIQTLNATKFPLNTALAAP